MRLADVVARFLWLGALAGAVLGAMNFFLTYGLVSVFLGTGRPEISAPQLAALAAESMVPAVVPYVIARAWDELFRPATGRAIVSAPEAKKPAA